MSAQPSIPRPGHGQDAPAPSATQAARRLVGNVERVIHGQRRAVELVVVALLAGGHVLVEDTPGAGKTTLARCVARSVGGVFGRVQATADLLPADVTGSSIWDPGERRFGFVPGPVFADVLLVDELNRTPPRTQSAFLEVMEERAVTVDGVRHPVPEGFFLIATQNPIDQFGTYPLPEGQMDRFAVRLHLEPLDPESERRIVREQLPGPTVERLPPVLGPAEMAALRDAVRGTHVAEPVLEYAVELVRWTRDDPRVVHGAGSRAAIMLVRCAQAHAVLTGRDYVAPDDVSALAVPVLAHRLRLARTQGPIESILEPERLVGELVGRLPVPVRT